jgi:hypothetical protein
MYVELSPHCGARVVKSSGGNGLSILATLISPVIAVCLSQYLHSHEKPRTTFALPVPDSKAAWRESPCPEPRLEPSPAKELPADPLRFPKVSSAKSEKQVLAKKLIGTANDPSDNPAARFVMLQVAKDIAVQAHDGQTAFQAIDSISQTFHSDANAMKLAVLTKFASAAQQPQQHKPIAEEALKVADQAVGQGQFMIATRLGRLALSEAERARAPELLVQARDRIADVEERVKVKELHAR